MTVYLLIHDDRMYDMGDTYVRGVYASEADAKAAIPSKEKHSGLVWTERHDENCCSVDEREVTMPQRVLV